ncbi:hypothetical protein G4B88_010661 [Cannabis sativa]|uniref:Uncharacterized protein n=1 Tax=Cannabis sativa TaxID=3483 RepID=A0A7J6EQS0_CANSA|nr:hypothetical protein G4B88_010661 [Cannabis sativa]
MAVVVFGNLALSIDVAASSSRPILPDRKARPMVALDWPPRRESPHALLSSFKGFEPEGEIRSQRVVVRGKANSKVNGGVDSSDAGSSDEDGNGNGNGDWEEDRFDWEKEMRMRVKEIEEKRELEKKAEELQSQLEDGDGGEDGVEETEEEKRMRVRKELEKVAKEQAERRETAQLMFELGQKAYGKGMYGRAIEFLEGALTIIPGPTLFGGEIQIWLAMAYEANSRHTDSQDIPRGNGDHTIDCYAGTWTDKNKDNDGKNMGSTTNQVPSSRDFLGDFMVWRPPTGLDKSQGFWIALALWLGLVGAALFFQN